MKRKALIPTDLTFDDAQVANLRPPGGGGSTRQCTYPRNIERTCLFNIKLYMHRLAWHNVDMSR